MEDKIEMFKVRYDGSYCLVYTLDAALITIREELENQEEDRFDSISVGRVFMTQEEIDATPEFEGF